MLKNHVALVTAMLSVVSLPSFANTPNASGYYLGLGASKFSIDNVAVQNQEFKSGFAFAGSVGMVYPLSDTMYIDGHIIGSHKDDKVSASECVTKFLDNVSCDVVASTSLYSLPVTGNLKYPIASSSNISIGAGAAINYLARDIELQKTGYQSAKTASENKFSVSPVIQAGISFGDLRLQIQNQFKVGSDKVGKGSVMFVQLQYGNNLAW